MRLIGQPRNVILCYIRPVVRHDSPRWQPIYTLYLTGCIPLSKKEVKIKKKIKPDFFVFDKLTLQNLADKSGDV